MKVCTDSCLFGAWVANEMENEKSIRCILDIGTGTGLLALMLVQKINASITAIEIHEDAAMQAKENFKASRWNSRLNSLHLALREYQPAQQFDLIICNPPFFENDLLSPDDLKNSARHQGLLKLGELLVFISLHLSAHGKAALLLPFHLGKKGIETAENCNLFFNKEMWVRQTPQHNYFRTMLIFSREKTVPDRSEMCIKDSNGNYTADFTALLKEYYLKL